jgi:glycosyltransferase involved in cell wall biosynthesis
MKFSIVMPTYNRQDLIKETLDTVSSQRFQDFELIIVDDGSSDQTLDVIREHSVPCRIFEQQHKGCGAARNLGTRHARGEYIVYFDSDDLWFEWSLAAFAKAIDQNDDPAVVVGELVGFRNTSPLDTVREESYRDSAHANFIVGASATRFVLGTQVAALKKSAIEAVGGILEQDIACTDTDLLMRLGTAAGFVKIEAPVILGYRKHDGSILSNPAKAHSGALMLIENENNGVYPGGSNLKYQRESQIAVRARAMSLKLLRNGFLSKGFHIYRSLLFWNARQLKLTYLTMFPLMILIPQLRGLRRNRAPE